MSFLSLLFYSLTPYITTYLGLYIFSNAWLAILSYHFIILIKYYKNLEKISYTITNIKILSLYALSTFFIVPVIILLWDFIKLPDLDLYNTLTAFKLSGISLILFILYFFTIHPILEELFWRFIITYDKNKKIDYLFDVLFAGYHILVLLFFIKIEFVVITFIILMISGMLWRYIKYRYNDHLTLFITHSLADLCIILTIYILSL